MKLHTALILLSVALAGAFPAAPDFSLYGVVRNEGGRPLATGEGIVIVNGPSGEVTRSPIDTARGPGLNYTVHLPMDSGTTGGLYQVTALRPLVPYTIKVTIGTQNYVPIQLSSGAKATGKPGERQRLDLTLGEDSDRDGIPDSWEWALMDGDENGTLRALSDVRPGDDLDKDGLSNLQEFQLGTYALDKLDGVKLEITEVKAGHARLRFPVVKGRTYHIKSSTTGSDWQNAPLALAAAGETQSHLLADTTTMMDVYVPIATDSMKLFRLYAE